MSSSTTCNSAEIEKFILVEPFPNGVRKIRINIGISGRWLCCPGSCYVLANRKSCYNFDFLHFFKKKQNITKLQLCRPSSCRSEWQEDAHHWARLANSSSHFCLKHFFLNNDFSGSLPTITISIMFEAGGCPHICPKATLCLILLWWSMMFFFSWAVTPFEPKSSNI